MREDSQGFVVSLKNAARGRSSPLLYSLPRGRTASVQGISRMRRDVLLEELIACISSVSPLFMTISINSNRRNPTEIRGIDKRREPSFPSKQYSKTWTVTPAFSTAEITWEKKLSFQGGNNSRLMLVVQQEKIDNEPSAAFLIGTII